MTEQRQVRVRRSPRIGVFLALGAVVGAAAALAIVQLAPADPNSTVPVPQLLGILILVLAPIGAVTAGVVALVLDRVSERRARIVSAERIEPVPVATPDQGPVDREVPEPTSPLEAEAEAEAEPGPEPGPERRSESEPRD